jgi:hypothetical protein
MELATPAGQRRLPTAAVEAHGRRLHVEPALGEHAPTRTLEAPELPPDSGGRELERLGQVGRIRHASTIAASANLEKLIHSALLLRFERLMLLLAPVVSAVDPA